MKKKIILLFFILFRNGVEYAKFLGVQIGKNCRIYSYRFGSEPWLIQIGSNVTITSGVVLLTHDGSTWLVRDKKGRRYLYRKIVIGDNVFIGINSIILPGVRIDGNAIIAAGSVVTKSVPFGKVVAGNPARIIGDYNSFFENALVNCVSTENLDLTINYKKRIEQIVDVVFKEYMS